MTFSSSHRQIYIGGSYTLEFDKTAPDERLMFYDEEDKRERYFYINKLIRYNIWEEINGMDLDKRYKEIAEAQNLSDEQIAEMKSQYITMMENICPRDSVLAIVEYETEDDIQLQFYDKDYLDSQYEYKNNFSTAIFLHKDDDISLHGFKTRTCILKYVLKDFNEPVTAELFNWYKQIPEEIITL